MPVKREIIYPFFLECCEHANDTFWEAVFEKLAYGRPPQGTYICKDYLCCGYKGKEFSYKIERKDSYELYSEIYNLLTDKFGLFSKKEKDKKKILFYEIEKNNGYSKENWKDIRKKNIKDTLYEQYVLNMKEIHKLDYKQCRYLLALVMLAVSFKILTSKEIIYENGKIKDITIFDFVRKNNQTEIIVNKNFYDFEIKDKDNVEEQDDKKYFDDNWNKYLNHIGNLIKMSQ